MLAEILRGFGKLKRKPRVRLVKNMSDSLIPSLLVSNKSESLRLLTKNERCE